MSRRNQILAAILVLQLAVVAFVFWPRAAASSRAGQSLFPGVEADRIVGLTIQDGEGKSLHLTRNANGWVVPDADDYPCQDSKMTTFLSNVVALKTDGLVTQTAASHKRLKVAEGTFERWVELELADGTRHHLYLGTSPRYGATHVRADDQNQVYLASKLSTWDVGAEASAWVDTTYFMVSQDQLMALTLENGKGRLEFTRISTDTWTMASLTTSEKLDSNAVQGLVSRVASVYLLRPLGKKDQESYGMAKPGAIVTLRTSDKTYTLKVGAKDTTDNSYAVIFSESPYYVQVSDYSVSDFVEKGRDDFLEKPPTPEPTAQPAP